MSVLAAIRRAEFESTGAGHVWLVERFREFVEVGGVYGAAKYWQGQGMPIEVTLPVCREAMRGKVLHPAYSYRGTEIAFKDWKPTHTEPTIPAVVKRDTLRGAFRTFSSYYEYRES